MSLRKPKLPECFLHWIEAPDARGESSFRVVSWRRNIALKGNAFESFQREVIPLLDGQRTLDEICLAVRDVFDADEVVSAIDMLAGQGIVIEGDDPISQTMTDDLTPQLGWFSEVSAEGRLAQLRVSNAHVIVVGVGAQGAAAARGLAAAGARRITLADASMVHAADPYFSGMFAPEDIGQNRAEVLAHVLRKTHSRTSFDTFTERPSASSELDKLVAGASMVLCCLESGELTYALYLNEACKRAKVNWIASSLEGTELVVGPGFFHRNDGPCYLCWRSREITGASNPQSRLAMERHLDAQKRDLSDRRENLAASADIVGGMLGAEAVAWLSGASLPNLDGCFLTVEVPGLRVEKHTVLRKPSCPVCCSDAGTPT